MNIDDFLTNLIARLRDMAWIRMPSIYNIADIKKYGMIIDFINMPYQCMTPNIYHRRPHNAIEILSPGGNTFMNISCISTNIILTDNLSTRAIGKARLSKYIIRFPSQININKIFVYSRIPLSCKSDDKCDTAISMINNKSRYFISAPMLFDDFIDKFWPKIEMPNMYMQRLLADIKKFGDIRKLKTLMDEKYENAYFTSGATLLIAALTNYVRMVSSRNIDDIELISTELKKILYDAPDIMRSIIANILSVGIHTFIFNNNTRPDINDIGDYELSFEIKKMLMAPLIRSLMIMFMPRQLSI